MITASNLVDQAEIARQNLIADRWKQYREIIARNQQPQPGDDQLLGELMDALKLTADEIRHDANTFNQAKDWQAQVESAEQELESCTTPGEITQELDKIDEQITKAIAALLERKRQLIYDRRCTADAREQVRANRATLRTTQRDAPRIFGSTAPHTMTREDRPA